jgi:hypothetical protein
MGLREEIQAVRDRALTNLKHAHDYYTYTKSAWRTLQQLIQRSGLKFTWQNRHTNTVLSEQDALKSAQGYVAVELTASTLQQFVSIFENFLTDAIREWTRAHPERLSGKQLSGKDILGLPDKTAIIDALIEKELIDLFYDRPADWFDYLKRLVNINSPTSAEAGQFAEIKATRDVLVHGQGIANALYLNKAGQAARAALGQPLNIPDNYHQESWVLIHKLVQDIGTAMMAKA